MKELVKPNSPGSYHFINLGCPKNLVDGEATATLLEEAGWRRSSTIEDADLIVITTCAFIEEAVEESVDTILSVAALKKDWQRIAVLGCLVSREREELEKVLPEVDIFLDVDSMYSLAELVTSKCPGKLEDTYKSVIPRKILFTPPHIAYLKVSEGCSNHCSYCLIPSIRGEHRSFPAKALVDEAKRLSDMGVKELVVVAQDTTMWGCDIGTENGVYGLIEEIHEVTDFDWIRLMYLHPAHIDIVNLLRLLKEGTIIPYLDIPIQHASDRILGLMNRGYTREHLEKLFSTLRKEIPGLVLRSTVIVGFPGESDEDFAELVDFIEEYPFNHLGVFLYSDEEYVPSFAMSDHVPVDIANERLQELLEIQMDISHSFMAELVDRNLEIIVDSRAFEADSPFPGATYVGRYYGQAFEIDGVTYLSAPSLAPGSIVTASIDGFTPYDIHGKA